MQKQYVILSGLFIMISIVLGAMGAHALKKVLDPDLFSSFDVAVRYQGFLSMGILILALNSDRFAFSMNRILGGDEGCVCFFAVCDPFNSAHADLMCLIRYIFH